MNVVEEKQNPFFKRKDVKLGLKHLGMATPSKESLTKELALRYGVDELQVQINYIFPQKGLGESLISAKILDEKPAAPVQEAKGENVEAQENKPA